MSKEKQIEEMREMASIMTEAALSACEDLPLMPSDTNVCYNIPCHRCKETRLLVYKGYRKQSEGEWYVNYMMSKKPSKRGRIIQYTTYTCSVCGKPNGRKKSKFCPECGAKMKGGE